MKKNMELVNTESVCHVFATSFQNALHDLLNIDSTVATPTQHTVEQFNGSDDLYFTLLFTGQVYGEFIVSLKKQAAVDILSLGQADDHSCYLRSREQIIDSFKEVINIASGKAISFLKKTYPELTITPPKALEGYLDIVGYKFQKQEIIHPSGVISCYMYIDYMRLDIVKILEKNKNLLNEEHQKQEELKRLNTAKSEFLANMSHELRTPLNGMIGMLDVLKTSHLSDVQREQFDLIYNSGEFLLSLISEILEFSKIESGKLEIEKKPFSLRCAIDSVAESLAVAVYRKNLDFNVFISPEIEGLYNGDETRIKQVLINLIGNAIKFTPTGSISLTAKIDNDSILINVIDTGIGIPKSKIDKIFESFSQADVSDTRRYGGTGLGLTISKTIVNAMGGRIDVDSVEAEGSNFHIRIPLEKDSCTNPFYRKPLQPLKNMICYTSNEVLETTIKSYVKNILPEVDYFSSQTYQHGVLTKDDVVFIDVSHMHCFSKKVISDLLEEVKSSKANLVYLLRANELQKFDSLLLEHGVKNAHFMKLPISEKIIFDLLNDRSKSLDEDSKIIKIVDTINDPVDLKILVAEDNKINQIVISTMLSKLGYKTDVVENGKEVLNLLSSGQFYDVILMDCQMPVMDGYEATREIRKIDSTHGRHTHIIALTANAFKETKEMCFESGMDDFATKPIKLDVLKETLQRVSGS